MTKNTAEDRLIYYKGTICVPKRRLSLYLLLVLLLPCFPSFGQSDEGPVADEIMITIEYKGIGTVEMPAMYDDKDVYLSITSVFDFLRVRNTTTPTFDFVRGYFLNESDTFSIDKTGRASYKGKVTELGKDGLIKNDAGLYMNLKYFKSVFGIEGVFYFRRLYILLSTAYELPAVREMKQELMRKNLNKLKGEQKADTTIKLQRPFFHFGTADWAVMSSQQSQGGDQTTLNLGLGGVLAGGELNASINYYSQQAFTEKLQFYQWRYVNNDMAAMRQVVAGKIFTQATSSLFAPVVGVQVTNAPTTYRSSYGTYRLSNTTEPNWVVELYVNEVLVDYTKADASGFYTFEVPLMYGYTVVKLRFYGPYGEQRTSQQFINIPFNFLPKHEVEYSVSGGIVEDNQTSKFSRARVNYGLFRSVTIGGGVEYLSSVTSGPTMPFLNSSFRLTQKLLLSGEYTHGVRSRGILSYRLPAGLQLDLDYTKYVRGQTAIYYNYLEQRKVILSIPLRTKNLSLFSRLTVDQVQVPETKYTNTEWSLMGFYKKFGINISTYASIVREKLPYIYTIATLTVPMPAKILFTTQVQYDYKESKPVFARFTLEKRIFNKGYLDMSFQNYFAVHSYNFLAGFRYEFPFTRVAFSALTGNNNTYSRVEAASGSLVCDAKSNYFNANNRSNVGKAAIVIIPFLDMNGNNVQDDGEPKAPGLKIRVNGGRIIYNEKDTLIRILDLEPYYKYFIELNRSSFDNISWQIRNSTINVTASPNNFTMIKVPVSVVGEVSGVVSMKAKGPDKTKGQGQISVQIYTKDGKSVGRAITESDGFFSFLGLTPGQYIVRPDTAQLSNLHYSSAPAEIPVEIKPNRDGDVADGLEFTLLPTGKDNQVIDEPLPVDQPVQTGKEVARKDTAYTAKPTPKEKENVKEQQTGKTTLPSQIGIKSKPVLPDTAVVAEKGSFAILVEVYGDIAPAAVLKGKIVRYFRVPVTIVQDGIDYKVEMVGFNSRSAARRHLSRLKEWGFPEALIIKLREPVIK